MNTNSSSHLPVIVATPNDAKKYSEAVHKYEEINHKLKKKKTIDKIKKFFGKIMKKQQNEKIEVDDQYCFSTIDDESNYIYTESSTEDEYSDYPSYGKIIPMSPSMNQAYQNNEIVPYNHIINKKHSKLSFITKLKEKKAAKKARKNCKEPVLNNNVPLNSNDLNSLPFSSPKMKELVSYDGRNASNIKNKPGTPFVNSAQEVPTPFSPSLLNTPYMYNYVKNGGKSSIRYCSSKDDLSFDTRKEYTSSIYSDDSYHLPDDDDNIIEDDTEISPPSSEDTYVKETKIEEKEFKNPRYNGHFDDDSEDESNKIPPVPVQRPLSSVKRAWDNPFGRISFIEYTIEKQKDKEKKENKNNTNKFVVTKPPLKNKNSKNSCQMIVSKRSISSLSASLSKSRQEEAHNIPGLKSRTNSYSSLYTNTLSSKKSKSFNTNSIGSNITNKNNNYNNNTIDSNNNSNHKKKDSFLSAKEVGLREKESTHFDNKRVSESNLDDEDNKRDSVVYNDKRGSVISVTNLIKYSDFYSDSKDSSFSSTNAGSHYNQALSHYNMYKSKKDEDDKDTFTLSKKSVKTGGTDENGEYDSNILNFEIPDGDGEKVGKEIKLSVKKSNKGLNLKSDNRKAIITEVTPEVNENDEKDDDTTEQNNENTKSKTDIMEFNPYLPCIPSANYLLNNPNLTRSRVLNINDDSFNVLKHANTLKANRRSIIDAEIKAKKEEEEKEKQKEEARHEKEEKAKVAKEAQTAQKDEEGQESKESQERKDDVDAEDKNEDDNVEEKSPRQPEDHYREYYEQEVSHPPEEESIDAIYESKDKSKNNKLSEIVSRVFLRNNGKLDGDDTIDPNSSMIEPSVNETSIVKSSDESSPQESNKTIEGDDKNNDKKEENTDSNNNNNNTTISTKLFNFFKAPSKYLQYNDDNKDKENANENDKEKANESENGNDNEKEKDKDKDKDKDSGNNEKKEKENEESSQTQSLNSNSVLELPKSPIKPIAMSSKLVRSTSLSLAKRHNKQIKESKFRNKNRFLERNNSTNTSDDNRYNAIIDDENDEELEIHKSNSKRSSEEEIGNKTVTFAGSEIYPIECENKGKRNGLLNGKEKGLDYEKTPTLGYRNDEETNDKEEDNPILTENGLLYSEPDNELNAFNVDDNIANKLSDLKDEIIIEEEEEDQDDDILKKIQAEMKKKYNELDNNSNHEISDTFSIASCSTFSSAI